MPASPPELRCSEFVEEGDLGGAKTLLSLETLAKISLKNNRAEA